METLELGNGETCPFDGCDFILGEDYDGDSFRHIIDKHQSEAMDKLFKPITLMQAIETVRLIIKHHQIKGDKMILHAGALGPIKDLDRFLTNMYNKEIIRNEDNRIQNETPEPQGENNEEEE
jgi:hypothetical protein